jgi:hypothetical protein
MQFGLRQCLVLIGVAFLFLTTQAQPVSTNNGRREIDKTAKPYRILATGKQITIRSSQSIRSVLVWSSDGNRVLEQRDINTSTYSFKLSLGERVYFMMVELVGGKRYSEKLAVQ